MTNEKLIEVLQKVDCDTADIICDQGEEFSILADYLIANGVTIQKWIPVTEMLPEKFSSCIVYRKSGFFAMFRYSPSLGWHFYDSEWGDVTVDDVTHWMPLPEPPKGDQMNE